MLMLTDKRSFTVEDVFGNFKRRQASLIKALTTDVEEFYKLCDPNKENLCLFAYSDGRWEVDLPREEIPAEFPEPVLGINFCRDEMQRKDWLSFVASHSDAWMISVSFYFGARLGFDKADRERLFDMINDLPSIVEVVTAAAPKNGEIVTEAAPKNDEIVTEAAPKIEKSAVSKDEEDDSKAKAEEEKEAEHDAAPKNDEIVSEAAPKIEKSSVSKDEEDDSKAAHDETFCGACREIYTNKTFWIACDGCDTWFHGKCVKITEARAEHIKQYKCPSCSRKKARTH